MQYVDQDGDAEKPVPPDNWDEETQTFREDEEEEGGSYPLPGESPDPYWFNE